MTSDELRQIGERFLRLDLLRRVKMARLSSGCACHFSQLPLLEYIISHDGCTQKELSGRLCVSPPSVATSTKRLQKAGLIKKTVDTDNRRCNRLSATALGKQLSENRRRQFDSLDESMLAGLTEDELTSLTVILDKMLHNISEGEDDSLNFFQIMLRHKKMNEEEACRHAKKTAVMR